MAAPNNTPPLENIETGRIVKPSEQPIPGTRAAV